ncbi:mucin-17-like [Mizuhopecten yessoensis]|uniref:mucin-17-like n=1 Tax=Mizuhopecten yessoensis TaxID=6573 RepID=UPI000B459C0A|nr:mucin-17-like [Mizuhopecten yessoensis]
MACDSLYFLPSEIARLVLGYLQSEGYVKTYKNFVKECPHLSEYVNFMKKGQYYPLTINGLALMQILEEYGALRVAETTKKLTPNPALSSLWCQFDSVVDNIKKRMASNSNLVYKGHENQKSRTRMQMVERRRNQIKASVTNVDPDIIQPHNSKTLVTPLVVTRAILQNKADSDYSLSQPASPSDGGEGPDDNDSDVYEMSVDVPSGTEIMKLPTSQPTKEGSSEMRPIKALPSPRSDTVCTLQNSSEKYQASECSTVNKVTELSARKVPMVPSISSVTMTVSTVAAHADTEMTNVPGSPAVGLVSSHKTPVKNHTTVEPGLEKSPRRKRPPKRKPQGELRRQNKSDSSIAHGIGSHNESSNSTDGSALENSFPQILEHIMNDPLLPHKLAENINKSLHPEVIPDPGTPAALPHVDSIPDSPFIGRSLEDILDQQETQMPASSINGIIELTERDPNFEWLFSAGVCYLDEAAHDRDFTDSEHKSRSNGLVQSSTRNTTQQPQPGSSGSKMDFVPASDRSFGGLTSENIPFTPPTNFMPISEDIESNLFKISVPNFSNSPTSNAESFHSITQYTTTTTRDEARATQFPITGSVTSSTLHQPKTSNVKTQLPLTTCDSASQQFATSAVQSVTICVTAQALATVTSHQPITSRLSSQPITTAVTSIQPITSSFSTGYGKETVESTLTSPHGFPVLSLRSSVNDDDLPDPLSSFTIQSPVKPCVTSQCHTSEVRGSTLSASYSTFVSGMNDGQHSSTPITGRVNAGLVLPCVTGITSSQELTKKIPAVPSTSPAVFAKPHSAVPTTSPKSLPTINIRSLMDKLEAKAKGEVVEIDLQPKPAAKPSTKGRGRKKNPPPQKSSPKSVQPKPLDPSGAGIWSSELSALVKIASPEKCTTQSSSVKRSRVTRSSAAKMSDLNSDQTVQQPRKTKKGNETFMAVLSPSGSCVHHVPVLEVNSLSEFSDAKDLVPMGQLVPTSIPVVTSSYVTLTTTQTLITSSLPLSTQSNSILSVSLSAVPSVTSSLQTECISKVVTTMTSSCLPFVQKDAPQTPPTNTCHTDYPSMPDLHGSQPSLPVPATTCDKPKDIQPDHASVLNDAYSADRDFLESPCSSMSGYDDGSARRDHVMESGVKSMTEHLSVYCGIPVDKVTQRDIYARPLDFGSAVPHSSSTEVSSPLRQPSFGRGKKTPVTKKKKMGRPPGRRSTRGKSQLNAGEDIMNSPISSREVTKASQQNVMSPTCSRTGSCVGQFDSCTDSLDGPPSQQAYGTPLRGKALSSPGIPSYTSSHVGEKTVAVTSGQVRSPSEPACTPLQDINNSPAGTPDKLMICTPTHTDYIPTKGATSQRQVLTLGNVGALSLHEVVNSPSYDDMASRDSVLSKHAPSPSVQGLLIHQCEQDGDRKQTETSEDISNLKLTEHYNNEAMETLDKIPSPHQVLDNAKSIHESEISSAVLSIQDNAISVEICRSSPVNMSESRNTASGRKPTSPNPHTQQKVSIPLPDTLQQLTNPTGKESDIMISIDNQRLSTEASDNSQQSQGTVEVQQSDIGNQSVTNSNSKSQQNPIQFDTFKIKSHQGGSYSQPENSNGNKCNTINPTVKNQSHVINQSQSPTTHRSQDHVINQSLDYQSILKVSQSMMSSTNILEDAMKQVFSASDQQQTFFSSAPVLTGTQLMENSSTNHQAVPCRGTPSQVVSSPAPVVSQKQFIVYSPAPTQTVQSTAASTPVVHSTAPVLTHSQFIVNSPAPVTPASFIVTSTTYPATPIACQSQFVLNSPATPVMVKSPATPLIVNSPATPQVVNSPAAVMATAPYKSVCSPAPHKVPSRAPTPQMEPTDFIPDRSGTIYVTPNVLAQMSCEKSLVVQQERAVTTTSLVPCSTVGSTVDNRLNHGIRGPDVGQSPCAQYQSDQDIFAETTDEEVAEPAPVLKAPSKLPIITEVSHDIAKIPSLFDTMDGHNQVMTQAENTPPPCRTGRDSPRYFSALSNSNDDPVSDQSSRMETSPSSPNSGELKSQNHPNNSAKADIQVSQVSDSDDDIDILGDWDHDLSAGEITKVPITEHTISHDSTSLCNVSCSPKKTAWQTGFATKPSSTTSAFIRKILEQKNTQQSSEKKSPVRTESISLTTQTASQKISPELTASSTVTLSTQNKPVSADHHAKEKVPRRVQVITLSKEVSKVSKDAQNAVQSARGPFKHPQELTPRKSSHNSGKLTSQVKHSTSNDKGSSGGGSAEKDVPPHHQYITPPKKRFTASLKSGDGLYFVSSAAQQGNVSTNMRDHSHQSESHNSSAKVSLPGQSPRKNRKSTLTPRKDIDSSHVTQGNHSRTESRASDTLSCHGRTSRSPSRAPHDQRTSERKSQSPSHRKASDRTSQSPSHSKNTDRTSQSPSHSKSTDRTSRNPSHRKTSDRIPQSPSGHKISGRSSQSPSPHRTVFNRTTESPSRSKNLERVYASPSIRRKVFETSVNNDRRVGKSEDRTPHVNTEYDKDNKNVERVHTRSSIGRPSSSASHPRSSGSGTSNKNTTQRQTSPTHKRGHKRHVDSYQSGEVKTKRAKKSNTPIDLTKLDVDKFLNSDVYIKGRLEK